MPTLQVGDEAPNFDLSSTEDVLLMLRDEVPRTPIVLHFFGDPTEADVREQLSALASADGRLRPLGARIMGVSPAKMDALKAVQHELGLPFPLLRDDRGFASYYGVKAAEGQSSNAIFVVDRFQKIRWLRNPAGALAGAIAEIEGVLKSLPSPTANLPKSVVNRLVDRFVN